MDGWGSHKSRGISRAPPPLYKTLTPPLLTNSLFPSPPSQELRGEVSDRAGRVKELEVELLTASQRLAAGASDHAQQMTEQAARLDKCKVRGMRASLYKRDDEGRKKEASKLEKLLVLFPIRLTCEMRRQSCAGRVRSWGRGRGSVGCSRERQRTLAAGLGRLRRELETWSLALERRRGRLRSVSTCIYTRLL